MLTLFYGLGLAATTFLLVSRVVRFDWHHVWAVLTRPPVHHPAGYVPPRLPAHVKLPPAPVAQHARRVIAWHTLLPVLARRETPTRWPRRGTGRVRLARRSWHASHQLLTVRSPERAPLPAWVPQRAPMPTWAHPPDPTLPPECRPPHPVVVGQ